MTDTTDTVTRSTAHTDRSRHDVRSVVVPCTFATTSFLGAALLFTVQPLAARMILPSFGGSATVWSTSSLLFQVLLLAGYVYAHVATRRLGARWQPRTHLVLLLLPLLVLPLALPVDASPPDGAEPVLWVLRTLVIMVGLPFGILAATGPLIQRWYAWSDGPRAEDPYFLFVGSNLGSFVGLLAYPFVLEPNLGLDQQRVLWSVGFGVFALLMAACAFLVRARPGTLHPQDHRPPAPTPDRRMVLTWCLWAFVASSMMLAVTAHLSTDIAAVPLLWVLPLAAYLASFVIAFARSSRTPPTRTIVASIVFSISVGVVSSAASTVLGNVATLLVAANVLAVLLTGFAAHARLAATRPQPEHLTTFYLVVSVGGALGGLLNGVLAPLLFEGVWEYLITLALLPVLVVGLAPPTPARRTIVGAVLGVVAAAVLAGGLAWGGFTPARTAVVLVGAACVLGIVWWLTPRVPALLSLALGVATVGVAIAQEQTSVLTERTFYGSYRLQSTNGQHRLLHGTTIHGSQFLDGARRSVPTTYYVEDGPAGDVMSVVDPSDTAVVGLGAGALAAYGSAGERMDFFEIDPAVVRMARDPRWFTYLSDSAAEVEITVGDGRLMLEDRPPASYDLVVLDAFSSDSIPVHLLTREAVTAYVELLRPGGSLAVHISNRVLDLEPVIAAHARHLRLTAVVGGGGEGPGATSSHWVVLTESDETVAALERSPRWMTLSTSRTVDWTDDYASVLSVLR